MSHRIAEGHPCIERLLRIERLLVAFTLLARVARSELVVCEAHGVRPGSERMRGPRLPQVHLQFHPRNLILEITFVQTSLPDLNINTITASLPALDTIYGWYAHLVRSFNKSTSGRARLVRLRICRPNLNTQ